MEFFENKSVIQQKSGLVGLGIFILGKLNVFLACWANIGARYKQILHYVPTQKPISWIFQFL